MSNELITVITPVFNCEDFLEETIVSVLNQTHKNIEYILVDDCSVDNSSLIYQRFMEKDRRVKSIKLLQNSGAAIARNKGIELAKGEYIAFLDSDDKWEPTKLEEQLMFMKENKASFSFTSYTSLNISNNSISKVDSKHQKIVFNYFDLLYKKITLGCSTVMLKSNSIGNMQMPNLRTGQDFAFWLLLLKNQIKEVHLLKKCLTIYTVRNDSISSNKIKKAIRQWSILRSNENLSTLKAILPFLSYAYHATIGRR
ncbi:glycosyltransferase family 2 protein [Reinekea blandensis]|uniref:Glycosyltransferase n=1 Tax=Reinekea blandensis MED297 TaxID=314283 RepID=A4BIW6_9GAMM|nr:glycosyltransferase family 2 protein [Reinekea blandensis]EAR07899.1 glycosyltransferase [Reinekea sp. MED297] [Reinekea blandensis MED297]